MRKAEILVYPYMKKTIIKKALLFLFPIGILMVVMLPNLSLPLFYDEAWSYFPAIRKMAQVGPSLLPGNLSIDDCKGHPQFFFFISSIWLKLCSTNIVLLRFLPLLISIGLLIAIFYSLLKIANLEAAFIGALLVSVQSMFLAQSIMMLPEILMALLFVLSLGFYFRKQYLWYAITSSLMVLTKETAIIFTLTFGLFYLFSLISHKNRKEFRIGTLLLLIAPGFIYAGFLFLHYMEYGVALYGDHLDYISFDWPVIHDKIDRAYSFIFIRYGRQAILLTGIATLMVYIFQWQTNWRFLLLTALSFLSFMAFSMFNFYTQRYGLIALVIFILLFAFLLGQLHLNALIKYGIALILAALCLYNTLTIKENSDVDLGYVETIRVYEDMVHYCEEQKMHDEPFAVTFNMIFALNDKDLGYVKGGKEFAKIMDWKHIDEARYFIFESTTSDPSSQITQATEHFKLIKSFQNKHAWGHIYENPDFITPDNNVTSTKNANLP